VFSDRGFFAEAEAGFTGASWQWLGSVMQNASSLRIVECCQGDTNVVCGPSATEK